MKRLPQILASGAVLTLSSTFFAPAAAADVNTQENSDRVTSVVPASAVTVKQEAGQVILISSQGEEVLLVDDGRTVEEVLADAERDTYKFHAENKTKIDPEQVVGSGETVTLYQKENTGNSEEVELKKVTVEEETDDLYVGETEVVEEGKNGKALKTTITTTSENNLKEVVEEKFTVLEKPEPKVVRVGTAEREEPPVEVAPVEEQSASTSNSTGNSTSSSNSNTSSNAQSSAPQSSSSGNSSSSNNASSSSKSSSTSSEAGNQKIANIARAQLGKPYVWGATGPNSFDCSGLVQYVMSQVGKNVPRTTGAQWAASTPVNPANIQVGDILWRPGHIGIYVGNGKIVHASSPSTGTIETTLNDWLSRGYKVGRL